MYSDSGAPRSEHENQNMVIMDYKKDGGCPDVHPEEWTASPLLRDMRLNSLPGKITCEDLFGYWQTNPFNDSGEGDICASMPDDVLYLIRIKPGRVIERMGVGEARKYNNSGSRRYVKFYELPVNPA